MAKDPREIVIRNLFLMQQLGNTLADTSAELLRALFDEICAELAKLDPGGVQPRYRRDRLSRLAKRIQDLVGPAYDEIFSRQRDALARIGADQAKGARLHLQAILGAGNAGNLAPSTGLGPNFFKALVDTKPLQGALLKDWFRDQSRKTVFKVNQQLQLGMVNGDTIDDLVRRIRGRANGPAIRDGKGRITGYQFTGGVMETSTKDAEAIARTAVNHFSNEAALATYEANSAVTSEYRYVATLDGRTTLICISLDGKVFRYDDPTAPKPPQHVRCRSIIVPIVDWASLGLEPPAEGTRASIQGQVKTSTTYEDWLKSQPRGVQDDVLGPRRAELFRQGRIGLRDLVSSDGGRIRLTDLQVGEIPAFDASGALARIRAQRAQTSDFAGASLQEAEDLIRDAPLEHAIGYRSDGSLAFYATNHHPSSVGFTSQQLLEVKSGVLTHNHPRQSSLSDADLSLAHVWNTGEMRAVSTRYDYSAKRPPGGWWRAPGDDGSGDRTAETISNAWELAEARLTPAIERKVRSGEVSRSDLWIELTHAIIQELARQFGFTYTPDREDSMILMIDPPVGPGGTRVELQAWVEELEAMRLEHAEDPQALKEVDRQLERARRWLAEASE